ncbi:antigen 5 like allergen Cul n 1 [Drosophila teissieri]|uniref:antigen 5 like allergen Cul n 1 n=1 Tax=Drosophila teissieri TaxID=7243 RepID=UPI001CBA2CFC|nr:antigen 5 like allergen Cul n 1 [Drosophila teissieri]
MTPLLRGSVFLAVFQLICQLVLATDYSWCNPELCGGGVKHIACRNSGNFHRRCQPDAVQVDVSRHKADFLHGHNKRRNFLALGKVPGYYPAARMATMVWDDELQYLSMLNTRTCKLDHDDCHNTFRYANSGQNLCAVWRPRSPYVNVTSLVDECLGLWFNEFDLIDSSFIDSFKVTPIFEDYGHFAEMSVDKNFAVGCSIMRFTRPDYPSVYIYNFICNYASLYALGAPVYETGRAGTHCTTGRSPFYPGLCSTREVYDPNW